MTTDTSPKTTTTEVSQHKSIGIGMAGFGTVGTGVYKIFADHPELAFRQIVVRDPAKTRDVSGLDTEIISTDINTLLNDDSIRIVVEVIGGVDTAYTLVREALKRGKHVVTANKELIAKHGPELFTLSREHDTRLMFEAAVAGGIPILMPLKVSLAGNRILEVAGILNGTTNYILTKMTDEGSDFASALADAQTKGFAEADPTNDVAGHDAAYKIAILSTIAFNQSISAESIHREGITEIGAEDIQNAQALGYAIKLIGLARVTEGKALDIRVHPMLVPHEHPLASTHNEYNAVWVRGDAVGDTMFYGKGAGEMPTASAVSADVLAIANGLLKGNDPFPAMAFDPMPEAKLLPPAETQNKYYVRLNTHDMPGVIGGLGTACGSHGVSLESVMQKCTNPDGTASIVLITHEVAEADFNQALADIRNLKTTDQISCVLRVL